jgi:cystine transport system permease protein
MIESSLQLLLDSAPFLLKGAYYTVFLSLGGMFFGLLLGFGLALMRLSTFKPWSWIARIYVSFIRGTPLLVQLFVIYYGLPQLGIELDPLPAALIGFSLNMAAYACEILRAAIGSIERGQWHDPRANLAPRDSAAGSPHRLAATGQQLHLAGQGYLAGGHHSGA